MADGYIGSIERKALLGYENVSDEEIRKHVAPLGKTGLPAAIMPPLLDRRRVEYLIPNEAWSSQPSSDTVRVWQVEDKTQATYVEGGIVVRPDAVRDQDRNESPKGILVAAGLLALDSLRSHGIELGHVVSLLRMSPFRMTCAVVGGKWKSTLVMHAGDIKGSDDTMDMLRSGELELRVVREKCREGYEVERHVYVRKDGSTVNPIQPWSPDET